MFFQFIFSFQTNKCLFPQCLYYLSKKIYTAFLPYHGFYDIAVSLLFQPKLGAILKTLLPWYHRHHNIYMYLGIHDWNMNCKPLFMDILFIQKDIIRFFKCQDIYCSRKWQILFWDLVQIIRIFDYFYLGYPTYKKK